MVPDFALDLLYLAPLVVGPGTIVVVYAWRRHRQHLTPVIALGIMVNMASFAIAAIFAILFLLRGIARLQ